MSRYDLAVIVLAAFAVAGLAWFAATRNGHRLLYVTALAAHRLLYPATGTHVREDEPETVRAVLREIALAAAWNMRNLAGQPLLWRQERRIERAVRGCVTTTLLTDPEMLRAPVAASVPGEGTAPESPASGAVPLTDATAAVSPYPPPTAPQPALREQLEPVTAARPYVPEMIP